MSVNMASQENTSSTSRDCQSQDSLSMRFVLSTLRKKWPNVQSVSTETLHEWLDSHEVHNSDVLSEKTTSQRKTIVLDARPMEEYQVSHIKGAIRVSPDASDVADTLNKIAESGSEPGSINVVCYCSLGYRSMRYADSLNTLNSNMTPDSVSSCIRGIYNLEGSLFKWANENRPMINVSGLSTKHAHPYSIIWGKLLRSELRSYTPVPESQSPS